MGMSICQVMLIYIYSMFVFTTMECGKEFLMPLVGIGAHLKRNGRSYV